jgi:hypothetical protein
MKTLAVSALLAAVLAIQTTSAFAQASGAAACPYTVEELNKALGTKLKPAVVSELSASGIKKVGCQYNSVTAGTVSVRVDMTIMTPQDFEQTKKMRISGRPMHLAGSIEQIAGDPELAGWRINQGDNTNVTLLYYRNNSETEVRVSGVNMKDAAAVKAMREKVLKLKRVP